MAGSFRKKKKISTQLKEWNAKDAKPEDDQLRYDFLVLSDDKRLVVIEIKRSGHAIELEELQRLEKYKERLSKAKNKDLYMVMICGDNLNVSKSIDKIGSKGLTAK